MSDDRFEEYELHGFSVVDGMKSEDMVVAEYLGNTPHYWAADHDLMLDHLFTPSKVYRFCAGEEAIFEALDLSTYARKLNKHPYRILVDEPHRWAAIDWATENSGLGCVLQRPDTTGVHIDDPFPFDWLILETTGLDFALTEHGRKGGWIEPPEVFFFKNIEKATLFKLFVGATS